MNIHIGKLIRKRLEELGMTKSEFARRINTSPQNIYGIFKRKSIDTELLSSVSRCLNFDFFSYYTESALVIDGKTVTAGEMKIELDKLKIDRDNLQRENELLKEIRELHSKKSR